MQCRKISNNVFESFHHVFCWTSKKKFYHSLPHFYTYPGIYTNSIHKQMQFYNSFVLLDFSHQSRAAAHFRKSPILSQGQNNRYMKQHRVQSVIYILIWYLHSYYFRYYKRFSQNCFHFSKYVYTYYNVFTWV